MIESWNEKWLLSEKEQQRIKEKKKTKKKKRLFLKLSSKFFLPYYFKNTQILKFFLPWPWPHYNLWKVLMIFECMFMKVVNIRVLLSIESVYLHGYFKWKHKPKHLSKFWWENIHLTWVFLFHIWLSCKLKRLNHVWKT